MKDLDKLLPSQLPSYIQVTDNRFQTGLTVGKTSHLQQDMGNGNGDTLSNYCFILFSNFCHPDCFHTQSLTITDPGYDDYKLFVSSSSSSNENILYRPGIHFSMDGHIESL